jgi:hypothetical protein
VLRGDHHTAVFLVDQAQAFPKNASPDQRVYGPASFAVLRLITCGGGYRRGVGYLATS